MRTFFVENVYRTNTASAYSAGKLMQYEKTKPVAYELFVINDERTSKICRHLLRESGYGMALPANHGFWKKYGFPPYHYQCRTGIRAVDAASVGVNPKDGGVNVENVPMKRFAKFKPQEGFGGNPLDRGNRYELSADMIKRAKKYGILDLFEEEWMSLFPRKVSKHAQGSVSQFIKNNFNRKVPKIEILAQESGSELISIKELKQQKKLKPISSAITLLENKIPEASFSKILLGSKKLMRSDTIAIYSDFYSDVLFLNTSCIDFDDIKESIKVDFRRNNISTDFEGHYVLHEAGHKWARKHLKAEYRKSSFFKWKSLDDQKFFTDNVSENAGRKPSEAVAELFAQKQVGEPINEEAIRRIGFYSKRFGEWLTKKGV